MAAGNLLGFRRGVTFDASENGVSFGRWVNSQTKDYVHTAQASMTEIPADAQFLPQQTMTDLVHPLLMQPFASTEVVFAPDPVFRRLFARLDAEILDALLGVWMWTATRQRACLLVCVRGRSCR